jgi:hypothetical protein
MKKSIILFLPLLLVACAAPVSRIAVSGPEPVSSGPFHDLRPVDETKATAFSSFIMSGGYGIWRKGDESLSPRPVQLLRRRAIEKLAGPNGKRPLDIKVHHFVVYWNVKSQLRKSAMAGALGGAVGGALYAAASKPSSVNISQSLIQSSRFYGVEEEYQRAYYTTAENPQKASVYVTYIEAEINGKRIFTKTMAPSVAPENEDPYAIAVEAAISYFLSHFGETVASKSQGSTQP